MVAVYLSGMDEKSLNLTIAGYRKRDESNQINREDPNFEEEFDQYGGVMDES